MFMKIASATVMLMSVLSVGSAFSQQSDKPAGEGQQQAFQEDVGAQSAQTNDQSAQAENHTSGSKKHKAKIKKQKKEEREEVGSGFDCTTR
jgi:hypothetical protein